MNSIYKQISSTLKNLRAERGWSLDMASTKTGVSKAMLGQIEREESSPTIATLWKIASGFNIPFSSFIADNNDVHAYDRKPVHRKGKAQHIHPKDEKILVFSLFPYDALFNFEVFRIELLPGCEHLSPAHQPGVVEHVIALEGTLEILVNGKWRSVKKNEGLRFNADKPHGYRNLSSKIISFNDIIHYP